MEAEALSSQMLSGWGTYSLELALKSCLILLLALGAAFLLRKQAAVVRHILWYTCFLVLLCLPFLNPLVPPFWLVLPLPENVFDKSAWFWLALAAVYLSGVFYFLARLLLDIVHIRRLSGRASPAETPAAEAIIATLEDREGRARKVKLLYSDELTTPVSWGVWRPLILMPSEALSWPLTRLRGVIAHEMGHIQRQDWLGLLILRFVCALYWFNPLVWQAAHRLDEEAEKSCDDLALLDGNRDDYAETLLDIAKHHMQGGRKRSLAKAIADSFLKHRLVAILDGNVVRAQADVLYFLRALLVAAATTVLLAGIGFTTAVATRPQAEAGHLRLFDVRYVVQEPEAVAPETETDRPDKAVLLSGERLPVITLDDQDLPLPVVDVYAVNDPRLPVAVPELFNSRVRLSGGFRQLAGAEAEYPAYARARGIEGYSLVEYTVGPDGLVDNVTVIDSHPGAVFDRSSIEAVKQYRFSPLQLNGEVVSVQGLRARFNYLLKPAPD